MKKVIFSFVLFLTLSVVSMAQHQGGQGKGGKGKAGVNHEKEDEKTPEEKAEKRTEKLTKELSLSADQSARVKATLLKHQQDVEALKNKYANANDKSAMKEEKKKLKEQTDADLKKIFTEEQNTKYEQLKEEKEEKKHDKQGPHGGGKQGQGKGGRKGQ